MPNKRTCIGDPLTDRQSDLLECIVIHMRYTRIPPTIREMAEWFGGIALNAIAGHLKALERKGYIRKLHGARGIQIIDTNYQDTVWGRLPIGH